MCERNKEAKCTNPPSAKCYITKYRNVNCNTMTAAAWATKWNEYNSIWLFFFFFNFHVKIDVCLFLCTNFPTNQTVCFRYLLARNDKIGKNIQCVGVIERMNEKEKITNRSPKILTGFDWTLLTVRYSMFTFYMFDLLFICSIFLNIKIRSISLNFVFSINKNIFLNFPKEVESHKMLVEIWQK